MRRALAAARALALLAALAACGTEGAGGDAGDVAAAVDTAPVPLASYGAACAVDADCVTGFCLASDHAPMPWCARRCDPDEVEQFCDQPADEAPALCVAYPDAAADPLGEGFASRGDVRRFCAPVCVAAADCATLDPRFVCAAPEWRGNPLHPGVTTRVCRGETIGGYDPDDDPADCAGWGDDPGRFAEAAAVCAAYCEYLAACQELAAPLTEDCCGRACFRRMTRDGSVDTAYRNELTCFVDYFTAFRDTALVCSEPRDGCGPPGVPEDG